jgi:hypothetical protein
LFGVGVGLGAGVSPARAPGSEPEATIENTIAAASLANLIGKSSLPCRIKNGLRYVSANGCMVISSGIRDLTIRARPMSNSLAQPHPARVVWSDVLVELRSYAPVNSQFPTSATHPSRTKVPSSTGHGDAGRKTPKPERLK